MGIPIVGAAFVEALAMFASIVQKICVSDVQIYSGILVLFLDALPFEAYYLSGFSNRCLHLTSRMLR